MKLRKSRQRWIGVWMIIAGMATTAGIAQTTGAGMISDLIKEAKQKLAPDRRTAVFDVHAETRGTVTILTGEVHSTDLKVQLLDFLKKQGVTSVVDSMTTLPQSSLGDKTYAVVSLSVANIRTRPDHPAEMGTQALLGTPLHVLKTERGGWFYVQTPDEYLGWTDDRIVLMTEAEFGAWSRLPKVIITTEFTIARQTTEAGSQAVSDLVAGCLLALKADAGGFYEVGYPDGRTAVVRKEDAAPYTQWLERAQATPETIVSTAKRFFGVPYFWGGTSAKGMDCSGFAKTVYFLNGLLLPRDASQQVFVGDPVETAGDLDLRPGDLLFFGFKATPERRERVTHVAISLGGKRFIHASGGEGVRINSLDLKDADYSEFREETFLRAKRIIGSAKENGAKSLKELPYYGRQAE
jgi:gamma-D-glutamyl-L-lysine dipeptidyl-peptidase